MSLPDWIAAKSLYAQGIAFDALIMAALWRADTFNAQRIGAAWPALAAETIERYNAPGGRLAGEPGHDQLMRQRADSGIIFPTNHAAAESAGAPAENDLLDLDLADQLRDAMGGSAAPHYSWAPAAITIIRNAYPEIWESAVASAQNQ